MERGVMSLSINTAMWNILTAAFILSSIVVIPNTADNFWIPKNAVFLIAGFILLAYNLMSKQERLIAFKNKWIGLILMYVVLSFGWYFYRPLVMAKAGQRVFWNVWNFLPSLNVILAIFLIKDLTEYTDNLSRWVLIAKVLCWVCFGFSCYAILQFFGIDQIFTKDMKWNVSIKSSHMITFMGNSMHSANFIAMLAPLCLMFKDLKFKFIYVMAFIALVLSASTISMAAFAVSFLLYLTWMKKYRISFFIVLLLFALLCLIYSYRPDYFSFSGRFNLWELTIKDWLQRPFTGWGIGSFEVRKIIDKTSSLALAAENEYLQILHDGGIFLFVLVLGYFFNLIKRIIMAKDSMLIMGYSVSLASFLILGLGSFIIWLSPLALTGIIYISALEAQV